MRASSGGKKRSTADFTFCCIAIDHFRRTLEETAAPGRLCTPSALALVGAPASFTRNCMTHPPRASRSSRRFTSLRRTRRDEARRAAGSGDGHDLPSVHYGAMEPSVSAVRVFLQRRSVQGVGQLRRPPYLVPAGLP